MSGVTVNAGTHLREGRHAAKGSAPQPADHAAATQRGEDRPASPDPLHSERYARPPGVGLMFASRAEIEAAPTAERDAYYAIVEAFIADPASCDMRRTSAEDLALESALDARLAGINNDWCSV